MRDDEMITVLLVTAFLISMLGNFCQGIVNSNLSHELGVAEGKLAILLKEDKK